MKKSIVIFSLVTLLIGFMIAIQFRSVQEPDQRDTRDIWEVRELIIQEKELQSELIREIREIEEKLAQYQETQAQEELEVLNSTLEEFKVEAGLTKYSGPGLIISISPYFQGIELGQDAVVLSPEMLSKLVNDLYMYGAKHISIQGQRLINSSVIRDINNETHVDGLPLNRFPIEIKVVAENEELAEKVYNRIQASSLEDEFFVEDLKFSVSNVMDKVELPAYLDSIEIGNMKPVEE
ncbi:MAG TPA: DUF881 domain-containing protein [Bacillus sp. (in: firmicutes)]|uniref:DUF881 domain-containing protein n=1 Tax=Bacillus litorisediminis TaxID=2922713 RepID=UPI001FACC6BD|nr:DUF881 domain-containing protein [Bacillus litorisediminis]HWO77866.1 DUF881 domain-containing protein [Bacillus sp. (in: firmicutes)]